MSKKQSQDELDIIAQINKEVNDEIAPFINENFMVSRRGIVMRGGKILGGMALLSSPLLNAACRPRRKGSDVKDAPTGRQAEIGAGFAWLMGEVAKIDENTSFKALVQAACKQPGLDVPPTIMAEIQRLGLAIRTAGASADPKDVATFEGLKALYATPHGKAMAVILGGFLKANPYKMFEEVRAEGSVKSLGGDFNSAVKGLFVPMFGPALIAKGDYVRVALKNHSQIQVPYGEEMWKAMIPDDSYPFKVDKVIGDKTLKVKTVTLSSDNDAAYIPDKKFNEDITQEERIVPHRIKIISPLQTKSYFMSDAAGTGGTLHLGLAHYLLDECKSRVAALTPGRPFNYATELGRTIPVLSNELYWGVLAGLGSESTVRNDITSVLDKHGTRKSIENHFATFTEVVAPIALKDKPDALLANIVDQNLVRYVIITPGSPLATDPTKMTFAVTMNPEYLWDFNIPDYNMTYLHIKACFRNFFNNVGKDPIVQVAGIVSQRVYLTYILWLTHLYKELLNKELGTEPRSTALIEHFPNHFGKEVYNQYKTNNAIYRKLQIQKAMDQTLAPSDPERARFTDIRIAEHIFGIVVGAVAGQEEASCRVTQAILNFHDGKIKSATSFASFVGDCANFVNIANDFGKIRQPAFSNLIKYVLEGIRLFPQGEIVLRKNSVPIPLSTFIPGMDPKIAISTDTTMFVAHGSAMVDTDEMPDAASLVLGRKFRSAPTVFQQANLGDNEAYLSYGYGRHVCQGRFISSTIIACSLAAIFDRFPNASSTKPLQDADMSAFSKNLGQGILKLDKDNLYAEELMIKI